MKYTLLTRLMSILCTISENLKPTMGQRYADNSRLKTRLNIVLSLFMILSLFAPSVEATEVIYYVDNDGVRACDGNSPCYTSINTALAEAPAYSIVKVYSGQYEEYILIEKPVTLTAISDDPHDTVISVIRSDRGELPVGLGPNAIRIRSSEVSVSKFTFVANNDVVVIEKGHVSSDGHYLPCGFLLHDIELTNNVISAVAADSMLDNKAPGVYACNASGLSLLQNSVIRAIGSLGSGIYLGTRLAPVNRSLIRGNIIMNTDRHGILISGSNNHVTSNYLEHIGSPSEFSHGVALEKGSVSNTVMDNKICDVVNGYAIFAVNPSRNRLQSLNECPL